MTRKPPSVVVTWTDAVDRSLECRLDENEIKAKVKLRYGRETGGLLVYKDDEETILAHDYDPAEATDEDQRPEVGNFTVIPTGWITKIRYVERGPRTKKAPPKEPTNVA